jgi:hypothetical protein
MSKVLKMCNEFELDDFMDVTIVMSPEEREAILAIDAAFGARTPINERPTVTMPAVTMPTVKTA